MRFRFLLLLRGALGLVALPSEATFFSGKRVLIAGASSGLGEALAHELSGRGAALVLGGRRTARLESVAASCAAAHGGAEPSVLPLDVTAGSEALVEKAAEATAMGGGGVDILCYCAGQGQRTVAAETSVEAHAALMAVNFEGAVSLSRALLPAMLERGSGHLCVVSSVQGFFGQPGRTSYAASKAAMIGYFDGLRAEVAQRGVGVT
eukprot:3010383-Prymnesium_polylepis.1